VEQKRKEGRKKVRRKGYNLKMDSRVVARSKTGEKKADFKRRQ